MDVTVIVEPVNGSSYRVTGAGGLSVGLSAEGVTAAEAIDRLAEQIRTRMNGGATLTELTINEREPAWKEDAGCLRDDPQYESWREAIEEYRREMNADPDAV